MTEVIEFFLHALKDTLPLFPWILFMYVLMELLQNKIDLTRVSRFGGKLGPLLGSATGLIPQCGFSIMAAKLFEQKYITLGTLIAIFFSTSDEAFIIMISDGKGVVWLLPFLVCKIFLGIVVGYGVDLVLKGIGKGQVCVEMPAKMDKQPKTTKDIFIKNYMEEKDVEVRCSCGRTHDENRPWLNYFVYPLLHSLKVIGFIFLVNFCLTAIIHGVGEDKFGEFLQRSRFIQPFLACLVGLIPNCASSVVLTETFLSGGIAFGSCVAGLCCNAGMGFVVLLKNVREWKRNVCLVLFCYVTSVVIGLLLNIYPLFA